VVNDQLCDERVNALDDGIITVFDENMNVVGAYGCGNQN